MQLPKELKNIYGFDGTHYHPVRIDASTHAIQTIEYEHHEIHGGSSYTAHYTRTTAATNGHRSAIYIRTPIVKEIHMIASFSASVAANLSICEGITIDVNEGTNGVAIYNRDRNSSNTSGIRDNATAQTANKFTTFDETALGNANFSAGTVLRTSPLSVGTGPKAAGGADRGEQEYILKRDTKYLFLITNTVATANVHHVLIDWYELTNRS